MCHVEAHRKQVMYEMKQILFSMIIWSDTSPSTTKLSLHAMPSITNNSHTVRRRRGLLAFLEDNVTLFPYDADACKKKVAQAVRRRRHRRRRKEDAGETTAPPTETSTLSQLLDRQHSYQVIVLFFYSPEQEYSIRVRNRLLTVIQAAARSKEDDDTQRHNRDIVDDDNQPPKFPIMGVAINLPTQDSDGQLLPSTCDFLGSTGLIAARIAGDHYSIAWQHVFKPHVQSHGCPYLMVIDATQGTCFTSGHEELALEWNDPQTVQRRWRQGESGLDCLQQALATVLFPSSCSIL